MRGNPPAKALYDMVTVAIVKNPGWGEATVIPAPELQQDRWVEQPGNTREITIWENFDSNAIMDDFYDSMTNYVLIR